MYGALKSAYFSVSLDACRARMSYGPLPGFTEQTIDETPAVGLRLAQRPHESAISQPFDSAARIKQMCLWQI
jgi:hypothetical protein